MDIHPPFLLHLLPDVFIIYLQPQPNLIIQILLHGAQKGNTTTTNLSGWLHPFVCLCRRGQSNLARPFLGSLLVSLTRASVIQAPPSGHSPACHHRKSYQPAILAWLYCCCVVNASIVVATVAAVTTLRSKGDTKTEKYIARLEPLHPERLPA